MHSRPINIAIIGAGPAGIFTADTLKQQDIPTRIDLFERLPVPFGLVRYGVAPDHPRIKGIVDSLHNVLDRRDIRLVAGIDVGRDITINQLTAAYDAVILTTGANDDAPLPIPGIDLPGSFGASEFVSWYSAHPDFSTAWPLDHEQVAVIGAGNVALDITRMLIKHHDDLSQTEIPGHVYEGLKASKVTDVHLFARRGPAEAAFSPQELHELGDTPGVDIIIDPDDMVFDRSSKALIASSRQTKKLTEILMEWAGRTPATPPAPRRVHLHFMQAPSRIEGTKRVEGITMERTQHLVNGMVEGTGKFRSYPVGQVYRAVGYASSPMPGVPFNPDQRRVPHNRGRVMGDDGTPIPGLYVSGWIKRGPIGLIGSTKSDAKETVSQLIEDVQERPLGGGDRDPLPELLASAELSGIDWDGWLRIDAHERALGDAQGRPRVKVFDRGELTQIALKRAKTA